MSTKADEFAAGVLSRGNKPVELFLGRTNPPHNGHKHIFDMMENGVFALVKGKATSKNKARNPFGAQYQRKLIKMMAPQIKVVTVPTGFLPEIINILRKKKMEVTKVYAGDDRLSIYQGMVNGVNVKLDEKRRMKPEFILTPRITSATIVRDAIIRDSEEIFEENMPEEIWEEFRTMKEIMDNI